MIAYTLDCIIGSEFVCTVLCDVLSSDAMFRYYILVMGDVQIRCLSHNCFFLLCCSFSSLLLNIGILVVHCRNLASALFLLLLPFLLVPFSFFTFLFVCYLCKPKKSLAARPAIIIISLYPSR